MNEERQHFVQQALLKEFTKNQNGFFYQAIVKTGAVRKVHTANVCYESDFYDLPESLRRQYGITQVDFLERKGFTRLEDQFIKILKRLRNREIFFSKGDIDTMIRAFLLQKHRTKYFRKQFENPNVQHPSIEEVWKNYKKKFPQTLLDKLNSTSLESIKQSVLAEVRNTRKTHLFGIMENIHERNQAINDAALKIMGMHIKVIGAPRGSYFITSDNPFYSLQKMQDGRFAIWNTSYGSFTNLVLPINSQQAIEFYGHDPANFIKDFRRIPYYSIDRQAVLQINYATTLVADEKIFCEDRGYLVNFVQSFRDRKRKTTLEFRHNS